MTREKKFFVPELRTYDHDLTKRWRVEWWIPKPGGGGKRYPRPVYGDINQGKTVEDRLARAKKVIAGLRLDLPQGKKNDLLSDIIEAKSVNWKAKTVSAYTTVANCFTEYLESVKAKAPTSNLVNAFLLNIKEKGATKKTPNGASKNTIAKYRNFLFTLYEHGIKLKLFKGDNPVLVDTKIKKSPQSYKYFTLKQILQFQGADIKPQLWLAIKLLFYTFIRPGEQRHMRVGWINFENRYIEVPGEFSKNGKTQKVSIPDAFLPDIIFLQDFPNNFYVLSKSLAPGLVQISEKWLNAEHRKVLNTLKIRGRYAFYSWKHTGAVKAVKAGINLKDLQLQLRHHSLDMVDEYLKQLGVMDSEDLKTKFPNLVPVPIVLLLEHKTGCTCNTHPDYNYCPQCGAKLKAA